MGNERRIRGAFARLSASKDAACRSCLRGVMERAMEYALASHDGGHTMHTLLGDNYGWAVYRCGEMTDHGIHKGGPLGGRTLGKLRAYGATAGDGWAGVLLADMEATGGSYYSISYERAVLASTVQFTKGNFGRYFTGT